MEKIDDDKSWDISLDLNKVGKLIFNETDAEHLKSFETKSIDDFLSLQKSIKNKVKNLKNDLIANAEEALQIISKNGLEYSDFKSSWFPKFLLKIQKGDLNIDFKAAWKQKFDSEPLYAGKCEANKKSQLDSLQPQFVSHFNSIKANTYSYQLFKQCL